MLRFIPSLFVLLNLIFAVNVTAQVVYTDPPFPTIDRPLTVFFDATEGDGGLAGFTGDIYAHTGVLTDQSTTSNDWRYVVAEWEENTPKAEMTRISPDLYSLEVGDIRDYYGVPESEEVLELAFVFRSADRSRTGRDVGGDDIFVQVYSDVVTVRFDSPQLPEFGPLIVDPGQVVGLEASSFGLESDIVLMELFVDDESVVQVDSARIVYDLELTETGTRTVKAVAEDENDNRAEQEFSVLVNPPVTEVPVPAGNRLGINHHEQDDRATLVLWAPEKEFIYLIGDFNDWEPSAEYMLNRETARADSVLYWITIDGLEPGVEYGFQYLVDGDLRLSDPFSHKVLSPWNDRWIPESVYPGLKEYPHDKTEHVVSILQTGREPWEWQATDYERPDPSELVVYELLIRDFLEDGTYATLADTLDYLKRLGVNAIELMPVSNFDGNDSWGYNPNHHLALDKAYGPADEFRRLVDETHKRGMAVILDVVYNHATGQSPLIRLYGESRDTNPLIGPGHAFNVFNHLNHDHPFIKYWLDRANCYWLEEYNVDGYRFDLTKGFATNVQSGALLQGPNPERIANLKRMADRMWECDPDSYIILEHFADNQEEIELANHGVDQGRAGMLLWGNHNYNYSEASMGWHGGSQSNFSGIYYPNRGWDVPNLIGYMESHDEQWLMFKNRNFGNGMNDYQIQELSTALDRQKLVGAFFLTIPGPKMIWQFGELGYGGGPGECLKPGDGTDGDCLPTDPGRTGRKPIRWNYYQDAERNALYQTWQWLLKLRHENAVFHDPDTDIGMFGMNTASKTITLQHELMDAVVTGNFGVIDRTVFPRFSEAGTWYDYFTGDEIEVTGDMVGDTYSMDLPPGVFHIYTTEPMETPPAGLVPTSARERSETDLPTDLPQVFALNQNYPNPFNPATAISYDLPQASQVELQVYNALGQQVATLVSEHQQAGSYTVTFDAARLSSGTYLIRMQAGEHTFTRKMMLVK
ncbi:MAG: alpha-amylase family glycosyl hydrolase [Cyclonatronaceae bacterium]